MGRGEIMVNVRRTSYITYQDILKRGILAHSAETVYRCILANPYISDREVKNLTKLEINNVVGRRNWLAKVGLIEEAGIKVSTHPRSNKPVSAWKGDKKGYFDLQRLLKAQKNEFNGKGVRDVHVNVNWERT